MTNRLFASAALAVVLGLALPACGSTAANNTSSSAGEAVASTDAESTEASAIDELIASASNMTVEDLKGAFALSIDAEGMDADELYAQGQAYETGDGVVQFYAMATAYYEAAEEAGSADAAAALQNLETVKQTMLSNSPDGQGDIFTFFREGTTASQAGDYEFAYARYYDDAFFFEDPLYRGIGSIGDLLLEGDGVEQDVEKAVQIYAFNASVLGKGNGYTSLGKVFMADEGTYPGVSHSNDRALEYFIASYEDSALQETDFKGLRYAADYFDEGYDTDDGEHVEPDYAQAEKYYLIAAAGNERTFDGTACYKLATYYEEGREGVDQDYEKAAEYYLKAVSDENVHSTMLGIPQTYLALGRFYENGTGVEQNVATAVEYYQKAKDAAQDNLDLDNAAGRDDAQTVLDEAGAALERLGA